MFDKGLGSMVEELNTVTGCGVSSNLAPIASAIFSILLLGPPTWLSFLATATTCRGWIPKQEELPGFTASLQLRDPIFHEALMNQQKNL